MRAPATASPLLEDKLKTLGDECDRFAFLFLYAKEDTPPQTLF